ncbi:MAG: hypothetical protein RLZZ501_281 [Pseudomonadota bacterium]
MRRSLARRSFGFVIARSQHLQNFFSRIVANGALLEKLFSQLNNRRINSPQLCRNTFKNIYYFSDCFSIIF